MTHLRRLVVVVVAGLLVNVAVRVPQGILAASHPYYSYSCPLVSGGHDFNGNGFDEDGWSWNPLDGVWLTGPSWGVFGDIPAPADYNGDGQSDRAVWRPSTGSWFVQCSSATNCPSGTIAVTWGNPGDIPVPSDYNADGFADFGVWRPSTGYWYILAGPSGGSLLAATPWGQYGDCPVPGRLLNNGAGSLELNVFRPSAGTWFYGRSLDGAGGTTLSFGTYGDIPFSIDIDGDGDGDPVVWRPSEGNWYGAGPSFAVSWGVPGDIPSFRSDPGLPANISVWRPTTQRLYSCNNPTMGCTSTGVAGPVSPANRIPVLGRYR